MWRNNLKWKLLESNAVDSDSLVHVKIMILVVS